MNTRLPRSIPTEQGIAPAAILNFVNAAEQQLDALNSVLVVRHGHVVAEGWWTPYAPEHPHMLFSLSKSFTSTAVGMAVAEGRLTVETRVIDYFPDDAPRVVSDNLAAMRIQDLLTMSTGHTEDTWSYMKARADGNWAAEFLARPVNHAPGAPFVYNTGATYMLAAILYKVTGMGLVDYLQPRLFAPLGIADPFWEKCPRGINLGGTGLYVRTEDIACFGQLYLQKGQWQGQQLVPATWVAAATARQVANNGATPDWAQGYGYQFWRCQHNVYRGDGAHGQFCIVLPEHDAVVAITAGLSNLQGVLDLVWQHLLPAFGSSPLPAASAVQSRLEQKLASLTLPLAPGAPSSTVAAQVSGQRFTFPPNEQQIHAVTLTFDDNVCQAILAQGDNTTTLTAEPGGWRTNGTMLEQDTPRRVAASGAWSAPDTYALKLCFYETPFCRTIQLRFAGESVHFSSAANVGPASQTPLEMLGTTAT